MEKLTQDQLFRRHLMFFALKQVLFVLISALVFVIGIFALKAVVMEFIDHLTKGGGNLVESMVSFFVGLFVILMLGIVIIFVLAIAASFIASILINYLVSEMDEVQRGKKFSKKIIHSVIPPLAGILAVLISSVLVSAFLSGNKSGPLIPIIQFCVFYLPANYYFDKKFYMEDVKASA
jgi:uncharacterized protein involved in cysteine biosynthesis